MQKLTTIGLGGGCHWCTEAVFQALRGVQEVEQGFIASLPPHDFASEAVRLRFDEAVLPLVVLLEIHLRTHASQSDHSMRRKYRSAVYATDDAMAKRCAGLLAELQAGFERPLVTKVLPLVRFELNEERFLNYRAKHPDAPFCSTHIDPKLAMLRAQFPAYTEEGA
ncbi:peptide-methionine (S)-S-oxide reductase [Parvularcula lutaonensis]|uniref:peptide-methionine (S)-S-oxide reductase n=1 Tax=Parvularcula lutaonensis TaxID=491923 RepID=A0ABV7MA50_9PROT|nr:peptide-methionine (S)-S-oxide reductase [Parvularcula lutaonensis]GGY36830.1 peptide methionine sulfoxide reductase MsrA [Parvularcula lutaonensis]